MSIAFPISDSRCSLEEVSKETAPRISPRRLAANRANAQRSTGPRSAQGKRRVSRNAMKHGLCAGWSCLPSECEPTFLTFVSEIEEDLRPRSATQKLIFDQIVNLMWRLRRLPESQSKIFEQEMEKIAGPMESCSDDEVRNYQNGRGDDDVVRRDHDARSDGEASEHLKADESRFARVNKVQDEENVQQLSPADILARRFSDDPHNGFILINRYERSLQNAVSRLMRQLEQLKRQQSEHADDDCWNDGPPARENRAEAKKMSIMRRQQPAWTDADTQRQVEWFKAHPREAAAIDPQTCAPQNAPASDLKAAIDESVTAAKETRNDPAAAAIAASTANAPPVVPLVAWASSPERHSSVVAPPVATSSASSVAIKKAMTKEPIADRLQVDVGAISAAASLPHHPRRPVPPSEKQTHSPAHETAISTPPAKKCPIANATRLTKQTQARAASAVRCKCDNRDAKRYL